VAILRIGGAAYYPHLLKALQTTLNNTVFAEFSTYIV